MSVECSVNPRSQSERIALDASEAIFVVSFVAFEKAGIFQQSEHVPSLFMACAKSFSCTRILASVRMVLACMFEISHSSFWNDFSFFLPLLLRFQASRYVFNIYFLIYLSLVQSHSCADILVPMHMVLKRPRSSFCQCVFAIIRVT